MNNRLNNREIINYFLKQNKLSKDLAKLKRKILSKIEEANFEPRTTNNFKIRKHISLRPLIKKGKFFPPSKAFSERDTNNSPTVLLKNTSGNNFLLTELQKNTIGNDSTYSTIRNSDEELSDSSIISILEEL